jgi:phosphohistidine phosphatase
MARVELYFLRHGEAGKRIPVSARDTERALTAAGKEEMERVGKAIARSGFKFDVIATSPLRRAKDTAVIVNKALKRKGEPEEWLELSPEGSRYSLYRRLAKLKADSNVLCVGHEPYLTTSIAEIISRGGENSSTLRINLKKGGLARISISGFNPRISGELRWLLTPKQVRNMS